MIDWDEALAAVDGDRELLLEILATFLTEGPKLLADALGAAARDDLPGLARSAHTLKAALRYIGATNISAQAARLEQAAKAGDLAASKPLLETLAHAFQRLCPWITETLATAAGDDSTGCAGF